MSVSSSSRTVLKNNVLAAEANEGGPWWSAEESQLIKVPTARIPVFRLQENNCVRERERKKKEEGSKWERVRRQGLLLQLEANAERPKGQSAKTQPTDPSTSADESQYGPVPSGGDD